MDGPDRTHPRDSTVTYTNHPVPRLRRPRPASRGREGIFTHPPFSFAFAQEQKRTARREPRLYRPSAPSHKRPYSPSPLRALVSGRYSNKRHHLSGAALCASPLSSLKRTYSPSPFRALVPRRYGNKHYPVHSGSRPPSLSATSGAPFGRGKPSTVG